MINAPITYLNGLGGSTSNTLLTCITHQTLTLTLTPDSCFCLLLFFCTWDLEIDRDGRERNLQAFSGLCMKVTAEMFVDQKFGRFLEILIFMGAFLSFFFHTNFYSYHHTKSIIIDVVYKNSGELCFRGRWAPKLTKGPCNSSN